MASGTDPQSVKMQQIQQEQQIQQPPPPPPPSSNGPTLRGFVIGSLSACGAVTFTNPFEIVKTRLQLQGESSTSSSKPTTTTTRPYRNVFSAFNLIIKQEGLKGLQRGLLPAYGYQTILNGIRLGMYAPLRDSIGRIIGTPDGKANNLVNLVAGAAVGAVGAFWSSPLFLVKTRMQSYTAGATIQIGHQHSYVTKGTLYSLYTIAKTDGITGLWRGATASMIRTSVGSGVQLSVYDFTKAFIIRSGLFESNNNDANGNLGIHFLSSMITGLFVTAAMNPFDMISTRLYNQKSIEGGGKGSLYSGPFDCLSKTVRKEGLLALGKGFTAHFLRVGPHTILTFVFFEQLQKLARRYDDRLM